MDATDFHRLAEQLMVVAACFVEDAHPNLVSGNRSHDRLRADVANFVGLSDRLTALSRCAAMFAEMAPSPGKAH